MQETASVIDISTKITTFIGQIFDFLPERLLLLSLLMLYDISMLDVEILTQMYV
jgi:hypothetical protein